MGIRLKWGRETSPARAPPDSADGASKHTALTSPARGRGVPREAKEGSADLEEFPDALEELGFHLVGHGCCAGAVASEGAAPRTRAEETRLGRAA